MTASLDTVALLAMVVAAGLPYANGRLEVIPPSASQKIMQIDELRTYAIANLPPEGIMGRLVIAEPINACSPVRPVPNNDSTWFLLVQRHDCLIQAKMINAQKGGYSGAIIYDTDSSGFDLLSAPQPILFSDLHIYGILITRQDGDLLRHCTWDKHYVIDWYPQATISTVVFLIAGIIIIFACVLMILGAIVVQQCTRWLRERRHNARHRLSRKHLRHMPIRKFKRNGEFQNFDSCTICLEDYQDGDRLRILPCAHGYHSKCIDTWLTQNRRVCPLCKRQVVLPGMPEASTDDETAPLLGTQTGARPRLPQQEPPRNRTVQIEVHSDSVPESQHSSSAPATAPGGFYSLNDEVDVVPRPTRQKRKKRSRRRAEPLDDQNVAGPSTSTVASSSATAVDSHASRLQRINRLMAVAEMGSDDEQPLIV